DGCDDANDDDDDNDGVNDDNDNCPETPLNSNVNDEGCTFEDDDGDGVGNDDDDCPNTPAGNPVNSNGCTDTDGDGVPDVDDEENGIGLLTVPSNPSFLTQQGDNATHFYNIDYHIGTNGEEYLYAIGRTYGDGGLDLLIHRIDPINHQYLATQTQRNDTSNGWDYASELTIDDNGNIYVVARTQGDHATIHPSLETGMLSGTHGIGALSKYDKDLNLIWLIQPGHSGNNSDRSVPYTVDVTNDYVFVAGFTQSPILGQGSIDGQNDAYLEIYANENDASIYPSDNSQVLPKAALRLGTEKFESIYDIKVVESGQDLIINLVGSTQGDIDEFTTVNNTNNGVNDNYDPFIAKYRFNTSTETLTEICAYQDNRTTFTDEAHNIEVDSENNIYISGRVKTTSNDNSRDGFVMKYDSDCQPVWSDYSIVRASGNGNEDAIDDIELSVNENRIYFVGDTFGGQMENQDNPIGGLGGYDYFVGAMNTINGGIIDVQQFGSSSNNIAYDLAVTDNNV
ncbi:SBBP repeat-containing protein, partial [Paraphotobacterium marinum]